MINSPVHHLGSPTHVGPLSVFPIWTDAPVPRRATRATLPKGATIDEMSGGSQVERLSLANPTDKAFLLPGGSVFDGGWQHRVLVHGVLVDAFTDLELDVRCVEAGRWRGEGRQRLHQRRAPLAVRGALHGIRHDRPAPRSPGYSPRHTEHLDPRTGYTHPRSDDDFRISTAHSDDQFGYGDVAFADVANQADVWSRVTRYERTMGASPSSSLVEVADKLDDQADGILERLPLLSGQRGVLIGIGGHPVVMEVFDHPRTLARQWEGIVTGVLADAALVPARPTPGHRARTFAARVSARHLDPWAQAGSALAVGAGDDLIVADGVATPDRLIHLSVLNVRHELVGAA